jgi:alkanesulfonate monooxygenase SsuD/methylene tetrahydromethanopterin reductase-like flavin-dependent oxidoreductase (luciferase family)
VSELRYGFVIPNGDASEIVTMAREAEDAGWDGVFIPDCISIETPEYPATPWFDPWVLLSAMAAQTKRIWLGTMLTAVPRRRPWKLARETVTVDHLSGGRLILPVGLGALDDVGFGKVGEPTDRKTRVELLDEGLDILSGLWSGKPFSYKGRHYTLDEMTFLPPPVQTPRIPIWVVGAWPREKSLARVLRYDGLLPAKLDADGSFAEVTPDDLRAMKAYIEERRTATTRFDIVYEGRTPGDDSARAAEIVRPYAEAGATWWMEAMWEAPNTPADVGARIRQGPPRVA